MGGESSKNAVGAYTNPAPTIAPGGYSESKPSIFPYRQGARNNSRLIQNRQTSGSLPPRGARGSANVTTQTASATAPTSPNAQASYGARKGEESDAGSAASVAVRDNSRASSTSSAASCRAGFHRARASHPELSTLGKGGSQCSAPATIARTSPRPVLSKLSKQEKIAESFKQEKIAESKKLGLWNIGNTCYLNSVLQALYECPTFRQSCIGAIGRCDPDGLLEALAQLFSQINSAKKSRKSYVVPTKFLQKLKERDSVFRSSGHHDAHEFFSYLVNAIGEELAKAPSPPPSPASHASCGSNKRRISVPKKSSVDRASNPSSPPAQAATETSTWLHDLFQGQLVYETRCLCCENVTRRKEPFFDIPLDIDGNVVSLIDCIRRFARSELLRGKDKYFCDLCGCLQEAERRLRFDRLPRVLTLHLKRFKFDESSGCYSRVSSRVEFPTLLQFPSDALSRDLRSTWGGADEWEASAESLRSENRRAVPEEFPGPPIVVEDEGGRFVYLNGTKLRKSSRRMSVTGPEFELGGVVVHMGTMSRGHYTACVKSAHTWSLFDDDTVKPIDESYLRTFFGSPQQLAGVGCGYLLFYHARIPRRFGGPAHICAT